MSETPVKIVVDLSKPKGERESIIPLTKAEIAERVVMAAEAVVPTTISAVPLSTTNDSFIDIYFDISYVFSCY
jgi:hypothetical protein